MPPRRTKHRTNLATVAALVAVAVMSLAGPADAQHGRLGTPLDVDRRLLPLAARE
jgi:hypothetical protein